MAKLASSKVASLTATIVASDRAKKEGVRVLRGNIFFAVAWQPVTPVLPPPSTCPLMPVDNAASAVLAELLGARVGLP